MSSIFIRVLSPPAFELSGGTAFMITVNVVIYFPAFFDVPCHGIESYSFFEYNIIE